jgi:hypothetical protein
LRREQAQLVSLSCPHCGDRRIESADDAVFFYCGNCKAVLEPRGGELVFLPCLWETTAGRAPEGALYVPFWVFRTDVRIESKKPVELALKYPLDMMVPASIAPERPVSIVRLADKMTRERATHQYSTSKFDLEVEPGRYSRDDAREAVELVFLSIERDLFSEAPGTKYTVQPEYKNLAFLVWEKSKLDLLYVPDEHVLLRESAYEDEQEERIDDLMALLSKELTRKRTRPFWW